MRKKALPKKQPDNVALRKELSRLTRQLERANNPWRRFFIGLMVGLGSALGASIIAAGVIFGLTHLLQIVGFEKLISIFFSQSL